MNWKQFKWMGADGDAPPLFFLFSFFFFKNRIVFLSSTDKLDHMQNRWNFPLNKSCAARVQKSSCSQAGASSAVCLPLHNL